MKFVQNLLSIYAVTCALAQAGTSSNWPKPDKNRTTQTEQWKSTPAQTNVRRLVACLTDDKRKIVVDVTRDDHGRRLSTLFFICQNQSHPEMVYYGDISELETGLDPHRLAAISDGETCADLAQRNDLFMCLHEDEDVAQVLLARYHYIMRPPSKQNLLGSPK